MCLFVSSYIPKVLRAELVLNIIDNLLQLLGNFLTKDSRAETNFIQTVIRMKCTVMHY